MKLITTNVHIYTYMIWNKYYVYLSAESFTISTQRFYFPYTHQIAHASFNIFLK